MFDASGKSNAWHSKCLIKTVHSQTVVAVQRVKKDSTWHTILVPALNPESCPLAAVEHAKA